MLKIKQRSINRIRIDPSYNELKLLQTSKSSQNAMKRETKKKRK